MDGLRAHHRRGDPRVPLGRDDLGGRGDPRLHHHVAGRLLEPRCELRVFQLAGARGDRDACAPTPRRRARTLATCDELELASPRRLHGRPSRRVVVGGPRRRHGCVSVVRRRPQQPPVLHGARGERRPDRAG